MDTDAYLMKSHVQKQLLRFIYHTEFFFSDGLSVYKTGRQTGKGLFLPGRQVQIMRQRTDIRFAQITVA